jgi:alkyl sulfatase BDS1-like metallo-beta-lactamase superfamily hydrolase
MNFLLPDHDALCIAENATHNLHNLLTLRGAPVRDPHAWAHYLNETIELFGDRFDVMFAQHHWPRWGRERAIDMLAKQRDLYGYLHDQTLRLMNQGHTGAEIAERLELPPTLEQEWHCRGYYGSLNHNVKAVYQRYMGWYDGNPAKLWPHPPEPAAERYVDYMGGADAVLSKAEQAFENGDFRWVAEVVSHVVFADPSNGAARELKARALEQLAYGAENATWRNVFLMGAKELREGVAEGGNPVVSPDMVAGLADHQIFEAMAVRLDGPRAAEHTLTINWNFKGGDTYVLQLSNGVLKHLVGDARAEADASLTVSRESINRLLAEETTVPELLQAGAIELDGDLMAVGTLFGLLDEVDFGFAIVEP